MTGEKKSNNVKGGCGKDKMDIPVDGVLVAFVDVGDGGAGSGGGHVIGSYLLGMIAQTVIGRLWVLLGNGCRRSVPENDDIACGGNFWKLTFNKAKS